MRSGAVEGGFSSAPPFCETHQAALALVCDLCVLESGSFASQCVWLTVRAYRKMSKLRCIDLDCLKWNSRCLDEMSRCFDLDCFLRRLHARWVDPKFAAHFS